MIVGKGGWIAALLIAACSVAGGCGQGTQLVANPDYQAWKGFAPGSYVTFEGIRRMAGSAQPVRVTERLVSVDPRMIVLERTTVYLGSESSDAPEVMRRSEMARIRPVDDPRTHPDARTEDLGSDDIEIEGKIYTCRVQQLDVSTKTSELGPGEQICRATAWMNSAIPGALVKIILHSKTGRHDFGVTGEVVDFGAMPMLAGDHD